MIVKSNCIIFEHVNFFKDIDLFEKEQYNFDEIRSFDF